MKNLMKKTCLLLFILLTVSLAPHVQAADDVMERFIANNCRIKAEVVAADER